MLLLLLLLLQSQMLSAESAARAQQVEELEAALAGREAGDQVAGGQGTWGQGWGRLFIYCFTMVATSASFLCMYFIEPHIGIFLC